MIELGESQAWCTFPTVYANHNYKNPHFLIKKQEFLNLFSQSSKY
jgi:hypothetical protein